ncbi:Isotrichodermin C-15 hydroxylase [Sphaceloma murrayae]|uniref:Isotrichodermin C-15 hydroxylase n=1 Tax=Sphaceloma murrayae TaxID=2082308 RepID=A0A2K1QI07_9PEZI|nr:Isotrichodermin C-15 hydroxylase [Sphaceloma murrayae]
MAFRIIRHDSIQTAEFSRVLVRRETGSDDGVPEVDHQALDFVTGPEHQQNDDDLKLIWQEADAETKLFVDSVVEAQANLKQKVPGLQTIDPHHVNWSNVSTFIHSQAEYYESGAIEGKRNIVRKAFRKFSEHAGSMIQWLTLLPSEGYTAPVCASIKIILQAAERLHDAREDVLELFADIPNAFSDLKQYMDMYQDRTMVKAAAQLYTSLARVLRSIMSYMTKATWKKSVHSVFKLTPAPDFVEAKEQFQTAKNRFKQVGRICLHKRTNKIGNDLTMVKDDVQTISDSLERLTEMVIAMHPNVEDFKKELGASFYHFIRADRRDLLQGVEKRMRAVGWAQREVSLSDLLAITTKRGYDPGEQQKLIDEHLSVFFKPNLSSMREIERITFVKESDAFRQWLESSRSSYLFVQDYQREHRITSVISSFSAELHRKLYYAQGCLVATHFCASNSHGDREGPPTVKDMLNDLLGQLIMAWQESWEAPTFHEGMLQAAESNRSKSLCEALRSVLLALPLPRVVFLVVDCVDTYEYTDSRNAAEQTSRALLDLIDHLSVDGRYLIKMLFTASHRTPLADVAEQYRCGSVLYMPEAVNRGLRTEERMPDVETLIGYSIR